MSNDIKRFSCPIGGKDLIIETGKLAGQANGACTVRYGDTVILSTVCLSQSVREGINYFPLMVDFDEKLYAAGKIKGSRFIKREGRPTDEAILAGRLVDRAIRPLFPQSIKNDVQVVNSTLSFDGENDSDVLSLVAASTALSISNIPWNGPIACVRVGRINGEWALNPSYEARSKSDLDLVVAANSDKVLMLEAGANEVSEDTIIEAIKFAQKHLVKIIGLIEEITAAVGTAKINPVAELTEADNISLAKVTAKVNDFMSRDRINHIFEYTAKEELKNNIAAAKQELDARLKADNDISKDERIAGVALAEQCIDQKTRELILRENKMK